MLSELWAAVRWRCARCQGGAVWQRAMVMNERCPVCDYLFEREERFPRGMARLTKLW